jgi:hypothetical protein
MRPILFLIYPAWKLTLAGCGACSTTPLSQFRDPAGVTFTVTRVDCDTLAKDSAISVTAMRNGQHHPTLLLKYDPWGNDLPQAYVRDGNTVEIHVLKAASILEQHRIWGSFKVSIVIDKILYPDAKRAAT